MSDNETLADTLAEFRKFALRAAEEDKMISPESVLLLADKAAAAAVREIRAERTEAIDEALAHAEEVRAEKCRNCERAPGNAAALRKALKYARDVLAFTCRIDWRTTMAWGELHDAIHKADAALAAPPRNCDLFASYAEAENYWHENVECAEVNGCFDVWLFAPAEGKEAQP